MSSAIFSLVNFDELTTSTKKSSRRKLQIAEQTIELIYSDGLENVSYEKISKQCSIVRGVIYSYFPTKSDLLLFTCLWICHRYQKLVTDAMKLSGASPKKLLETYVKSSLTWVDVLPKDVAVMLIFFHHCIISEELAQANREMADIGTQRAVAILQAGIQTKDFSITEDAIPTVARQIQLLLAGALLSRAVENRTPQDWEAEHKMVLSLSMNLSGCHSKD